MPPPIPPPPTNPIPTPPQIRPQLPLQLPKRHQIPRPSLLPSFPLPPLLIHMRTLTIPRHPRRGLERREPELLLVNVFGGAAKMLR